MESIAKFVPVTPVTPPAPYVGGKSRLAKRLIGMIDSLPHRTYAEPFLGMGGVFLRRHRKPPAEVINDLSADVSTFFRILQRHYVAFLDMLRFQLTSRAEFERLKACNPDTLTDLERSARFLYLQCTTYGGLREGVFGLRPHRPGRFDVTRLQPALEDLHERLSGVVIERLPFDVFLAKYDRPETLFFIDPPYWGIEGLYGKDLFSRSDYELLRARLQQLAGAFILTINDKPEVRAFFGEFAIAPVEFRYTVSHGTGKELIITNRPDPFMTTAANEP
ncbi:DNA adenine methylase [Sphingosinicella sp. CPCC 101087]|uniref:DNA adenine methylase n=1 Tax=Sphingosinicella sp. CPCC 101087 TaxID=2497754 RepID=UPI00101DCB21|nr:DNA adenine methylase [Sphingosinicella sp. CPCC 101087]